MLYSNSVGEPELVAFHSFFTLVIWQCHPLSILSSEARRHVAMVVREVTGDSNLVDQPVDTSSQQSTVPSLSLDVQPRSVAIYSHVACEVRQWTAATILLPPPLLLPLLLLLLLSLLSSFYSSSSAATRQAVRWLHDLGVQEACSGELSMIGVPENEWVYQRVSLTLIFLFWRIHSSGSNKKNFANPLFLRMYSKPHNCMLNSCRGKIFCY